MRFPKWCSAASVFGSALLASGLFALYSWVAHNLRGEGGGLVRLAEHAVVVGVVVAGIVFLVLGAARRSRRHLLEMVRQGAVAVRENPAPNVLSWLGARACYKPEVGEVTAELDALAACYRRSLDRVAALQAELEEMRRAKGLAWAGSGAHANGRMAPAPSHFVVGSSRHRMVVRLAPNLHVMAATVPLQELLGYAPSAGLHTLVARSFLDVVHPDDVPALKRALEEALKEGEGHAVNFRVCRRRSGKADSEPAEGVAAGARHVQLDAMTWYSETGAPLHLRCHLLDITDRVLTERHLVRSQEELSASNARLRQANEDMQRLKESYRDLYHHAPVHYFSLDARGHLVAFNESMLRALGYPREELLDRPYSRLLPPAQRSAFEAAGPGALQRPGELETQWIKQDGTIIDVWIGTTTIRDLQGQFVRSRSVANDVTERHQLANALRIEAERVGRANDQLRRTNQELEEFTYVVSHDLKEPLRTLEAFSNFLAQDYGNLLGAEGHEYIAHLIQASRRLGALIDDLLALSRAGRVLNTPRPFAYEEAVEVALSDLRDLIHRKQAAVRVEGPLPCLSGDAERIVQLLSNLVANGLKYNPGPHPEVVIGVEVEEAGPGGLGESERPLVKLFVRDNGVGIDPAYHAQIFRIFRRLHRRDEVEGTGAGLAICKKIVEAHGGRIWVESGVGQGATFYFTLPRAATAKPKAEGRKQKPAQQLPALAASSV